MKIAISGASGKMGKNIIIAAQQFKNIHINGALDHHSSAFIGSDVGEIAGVGHIGVTIADDINHIPEFDVLIDFTRPEGTISYLDFCRQNHKKMVIGTTGFSSEDYAKIDEASHQIGIVLSANYSVGVNLLLKLIEKTAHVIGNHTDIEIIEAHHRHKVDAPSGTALAMGNSIAGALGKKLDECAVYSREGHTGERKAGTFGFATIRAGDIVGEHTALFADIGESLEITHKATSRMTFANGAIKAALWLNQQSSGLYSMSDVLSLDDVFA